MKKYFISDTNEEVLFGDVIQVDLTKEGSNGVHTFSSEVKFCSELAELLITSGVIQEEDFDDDSEDTDDMIDFGPCCMAQKLLDTMNSLKDSIDRYVQVVDKLTDTIASYTESLKDVTAKIKNNKNSK